MDEYIIKITGDGTAADIIKALRAIADSMESKTIRETLDSPEIEDLDGAEWEDCTLMTTFTKK